MQRILSAATLLFFLITTPALGQRIVTRDAPGDSTDFDMQHFFADGELKEDLNLGAEGVYRTANANCREVSAPAHIRSFRCAPEDIKKMEKVLKIMIEYKEDT